MLIKTNAAYFSQGFPSQKGCHQLHQNPSWAEAVCEDVLLDSSYFYPDKSIHVQVTVNHANYSDPTFVHDAMVAWVENVRNDSFTVCATQAGRNERQTGSSFASIDWLAYQGAPERGVSGGMDMPTWWTGTSCRTVLLPAVNTQIWVSYLAPRILSLETTKQASSFQRNCVGG